MDFGWSSQKTLEKRTMKHLWLTVDGQLCPRGSGSTLDSCTLLCPGQSNTHAPSQHRFVSFVRHSCCKPLPEFTRLVITDRPLIIHVNLCQSALASLLSLNLKESFSISVAVDTLVCSCSLRIKNISSEGTRSSEGFVHLQFEPSPETATKT